MNKYSEFIFEKYSFDTNKNEVELHYSLDGELEFTETIRWEVSTKNCDEHILDEALFGLWIMCGISYFKTYLPKKITIKKSGLTKSQAKFFNKIYTHGLAQFFYTNQLEWEEAINFEATKEEVAETATAGGEGCISALGGGKDSIVAAELLKRLGMKPECWSVNQAERFLNLSKKIGTKTHKVTREIDPLLAKLNSEGAYNGHVPITAINSFIGIVLAILLNKKSIIWAIEGTAEEPNTKWKGLDVNHQYSKTLEFEKDMQDYIFQNIAKDIEHYSILRPLTELRIAEVFCNNYLNDYQGLFSSCNANFTIGNDSELRWCGKCPKCAFVFIIFSPFLKKTDLLNLFGGKDIFADEEMAPIIKELLGITGHKPLECVGEIAETRLAVQMAKQSGQYPELSQYNFPEVKYDYRKWLNNSVPKAIDTELKETLEIL